MSETKSTFETLDVWTESRKLRSLISGIAKTLPLDEKFRLADQIIKVARSITANIAEGYGRFHYQENIQFCRQVRGSLYELLDHLTVSLDEKYITEETFLEIKTIIFSVVKILKGYISYLKERKNEPLQPT